MSWPRFHGLACPRCRQCRQFHVDITATVSLDAYGSCVESDYYWDGEASITCLDCNEEGIVADFTNLEAVSL